jgi:outer membrane lipopolysaccharide assembly protein LptE/RlpB
MRQEIAAAVLFVLVVMTSACGYALTGRQNNLPAHIRSIGIPAFINLSSTPDVDIKLAEAVRAEFQGRGRYLIQTTEAGVDAVMVATITGVTLTPANFADRQASRYFLIVTASIEFKDLRDNGKVLWSHPAFQERDEYDVANSTVPTDVAALLRTDTNAMDRVARKFARSTVTSILETF